jgi:hypothetical protein
MCSIFNSPNRSRAFLRAYMRMRGCQQCVCADVSQVLAVNATARRALTMLMQHVACLETRCEEVC